MTSADTRYSLVLVACVAATWILGASSNAVVTLAQRDAYRSPRAPRTVDVSSDGRTIVFQSLAGLVPADTNDRADIYVLDRSSGAVTLESSAAQGAEHSHPRTSGDGRYLVFESLHGDHPGDVVLRDRVAGTTRVLTANDRARDPQAWSRSPVISGDGRVVAFSSVATHLTEDGDANGRLEDVYILTLAADTVTRASVSSTGVQMPQGNSILPTLSGDGRWLAFASTAPLTETTARDKPRRHVYLRDLRDGRTVRVTRTAHGGAPNGDSSLPSISGDGRYVAFVTEASNLLNDDHNQGADVLLYDRDADAVSWVSRGADGSSANGESTSPVISADGRFVAFQSDASNLVCPKRCADHADDINLLWDVFLFDRVSGRIVRVSEDDLGSWMEASAGPAVDATGSIVAFSSRHPVDSDDRRDDFDLFVRAMPPPPTITRKVP
jgi:Tol biopolymer transport system component